MSKPEYSVNEDKTFGFTTPIITVQAIPAGRYVIDRVLGGYKLTPVPLATVDSYVPLPNPASDQTSEIIQDFIQGTFRDSMAEFGMVHKLACLMWGEPGTSKSVTIYEATRFAIDHGCIVIDATGDDPDMVSDVLESIRKIEPTRSVIVIWEEIDSVITLRYETELLQLLDGPSQVNDVLYLMTTNYIKDIPGRLFLRCRRIPFQVQFHLPSREIREAYFRAKIPADKLETISLPEWLDKTEGFSIDQCAQCVVTVFAFRRTLADVINDLAERKLVIEDKDDSDD